MELIEQSLELMLIGMGSVFAFLGLLVGLIQLSSRWLAEAEIQVSRPLLTGATAAVSPAVVAAITAAVHQHQTAERETKP